MSKEGYTHIIVILDRSGSMSSIKSDMDGGFNDFIKKQKAEKGVATLTLAQFDTEHETVYDNVALEKVANLDLQPRGGTALLDAMGKTLTEERERIKKMDSSDSPEKIVCITITDGQENSSSQYSKSRVFEMIKDLEGEEDPQWDFVFLGANQDAIAEGGNIGIRASAAMTYDASSQGATMAFAALSDSITSYRVASKGTRYAFSDEDRKKQEKILDKTPSPTSRKKFNKAIPTRICDLVEADEDTK